MALPACPAASASWVRNGICLPPPDVRKTRRCIGNSSVAESTFQFQPARWLGDIAPHLLDGELRAAVASAKSRGKCREEAEARIPAHLLYTAGWPRVIPTLPEALLLCEVRREVARAVGIGVRYTEPLELIRRYEELLARRKEATP